RIRIIAKGHVLRLSPETCAEGYQIANCSALNVRSEQNYDITGRFQRSLQLNERFRCVRIKLPLFSGKPANSVAFSTFGYFDTDSGFAMNLARLATNDVELLIVMPHTGANLPGDERILVCYVIADEQHGVCRVDILHRRECRACFRSKRCCQPEIVGRAVMIDIICAERCPREAVQ